MHLYLLQPISILQWKNICFHEHTKGTDSEASSQFPSVPLLKVLNFKWKNNTTGTALLKILGSYLDAKYTAEKSTSSPQTMVE